jgi:hypothetical protein
MGRSPKRRWDDGDAAGLFGVVLEICLHVFVGVVADDLDGVLVGAHGAVAAQTPELCGYGARRRGVRRAFFIQGQVGHIVVDAHGEAAAGLVLFKLPVDREYIRRGRVLGARP